MQLLSNSAGALWSGKIKPLLTVNNEQGPTVIFNVQRTACSVRTVLYLLPVALLVGLPDQRFVPKVDGIERAWALPQRQFTLLLSASFVGSVC